ncbi:hypothetical protein SteCoe_33946 [Stentor coeruleus]|uniref:RING-type domain-containing protein n=1 Tax=Stentor coeruleus TaxID=5963 RepID=A0A1R2AVL3_9CILI|nr:hypothetical protein SteCoe_33946 [Stentor coeruleus]
MKKKNGGTKSNDINSQFHKTQNSPLIDSLKLPQLSKLSSPLIIPKSITNSEETPKSGALNRKSNKSLHNLAFSKLTDELLKPKIEDRNWVKEEPKTPNIKTEFEDIEHIFINDDHQNHEKNDYRHEPVVRRMTKNISGIHNSDVPIKSKKYRIEKNHDTVHTSQEELETFKQILENEKKKYQELEEKYNLMALEKSINDNIISKTNGKLSETDKSAIVINFYKAQLADAKSKMQLQITKSDKDISNIREELHVKNLELEQISSLLSKTDMQRKRYAETAKTLENEVENLKYENLILNSKIEEANSQLKSSIQNLKSEQNKTNYFENTYKELDSLKSLSDSLKEQSEIVSKENAALKTECNELKALFSRSKNLWREKKRKLKENIQILSEKVEKEKMSISNKVADAFRTKRSYTIKEPIQNAAFGKETISRLQVKIYDLESENSSLKSENEKSMKSLDYFKNTLESKTKMIGLLEAKLNKITENELDIGSSRENGKILSMLEKSLHEINDVIQCTKCKNDQACEYLMIPCEHTVCSKCIDFEENCPVCLNSARIFAITVFNDVKIKINHHVDLLNCLKNLNTLFD